ncbi:alpha/beta hydrolase [Aestuariibacter sp. AA17]|uniref:Alpha/beta hydrolase n=1 Tax=Fluctibacter corallii TaxID=2984329 RepID=A0ABT3ACL8_9ALTE|nr:alpha/beta hydrolase [Aestuariibacter sp. AA17]MCV2886322.1 alpha/beta hydrolase [Aestuariibacter sp. AA17]
MKHLVIALLRLKFFILSYVAPKQAVNSATTLFFTPRRHAPRAQEEAIKKDAIKHTLDDGTVYYEWGEGEPILFIHGWEGRATQVCAMLSPLVNAGFKVYAVDAPAHGDSSGDKSHPGFFVSTLFALEEKIGAFHTIIGHSMGGGSATYAITQGLKTKKVVTIAGPSNFHDVVKSFVDFIGLQGKAKSLFMAFVAEEVGIPYAQIATNKLSDATQVLVLHDEDDREIPVKHALAYKDDALVKIHISKGLGHRKILYTNEAISVVVDFIRQDFSHSHSLNRCS